MLTKGLFFNCDLLLENAPDYTAGCVLSGDSGYFQLHISSSASAGVSVVLGQNRGLCVRWRNTLRNGSAGAGRSGEWGGDASKRGRMVRKWRSFFQNTVISIFSQTVPFLSMLQARSSAGTLDHNHAGVLLVPLPFHLSNQTTRILTMTT